MLYSRKKFKGIAIKCRKPLLSLVGWFGGGGFDYLFFVRYITVLASINTFYLNPGS